MDDSAPGGTVGFNCASPTIPFSAFPASIYKNMTIDGANQGRGMTLDGSATVSLFTVQAGVAATIRNITLSNGARSSGPGGALWNLGALTLTNTVITGSAALNGWAGGGLANDVGARLTVRGGRIERNR